MTKFLGFTALSTVLILAAGAAQADVFYWQDPESGASITFPDRWETTSNKNPGDVLTINAPGANDFATCRLNVQPEGRFKIYPIGYSDEIQRTRFSLEFLEQKVFAHYDDVSIDQFSDNAGLGRGFASWASATYTTAYGPKMRKQAMAYVSYYNNHVYTLECSAEASAYARWYNPFLSVLKSVDFKKTTNHNYTGYYRNFLGDRTLVVHGERPVDDYYR